MIWAIRGFLGFCLTTALVAVVALTTGLVLSIQESWNLGIFWNSGLLPVAIGYVALFGFLLKVGWNG